MTGDGAAAPYPGLVRLGVKVSLRDYLKDLWRRRDFMVTVPLGDLRAEHLDTVLGSVWHLLNPALLIGIYYVVFGVVLKTHRGIDDFLTFLAIGVFLFQWTQRAATAGASTIAASEGLLRSIAFPRAVLPISSLVMETLAFLPSVLVMLVVALLDGARIRWSWLNLVPVLGLQLLFNAGFVFVVARLADRFRDVTQVLPYLFRILLYLSGVLFAVDRWITNDLLRRLYVLNPIYSIISLARGAVLGLDTGRGMWVSSIVWAFGFLAAGFWFFRAAEHRYGRG